MSRRIPIGNGGHTCSSHRPTSLSAVDAIYDAHPSIKVHGLLTGEQILMHPLPQIHQKYPALLYLTENSPVPQAL